MGSGVSRDNEIANLRVDGTPNLLLPVEVQAPRLSADQRKELCLSEDPLLEGEGSQTLPT